MATGRGGRGFGQRQPPLYVSIQKILDKYPDGQIFKEIIQNADDAGATEVHFYLDNRQHGTYSLVDPKLAQFQGPALLAYNNAVFTESDWQSIQDLQQSVKSKDPFKVGKFGIGFNSVYHITDLPTILSGDHLAYLEPHEEIWPKETGQWYQLSEETDKSDTFAPFDNLNGFRCGMGSFQGTFLRFSLRSESREKRVSSHVYTVDKLREILSALRDEAKVMLLFLRSVLSVTVHEISEEGLFTELLCISCKMGGIQLSQRSEFYRKLKDRFKQVSYEIQSPIECMIRFKVKVIDSLNESNNSDSEWLVASRVGSSESEVRSVAKSLDVLPWVGVALEISDTTSSEGGRVFCVLPMPSEVSCHLPVHVNATFSLNDERRELKWSGIERRNDRSADWNGMIVHHLLPHCYAGLLLRHAKKLLGGERFYRAWPDVNGLRYQPNWRELLKPLFRILFANTVFLTDRQEWVHYEGGLFIPRDGDIPDIVPTVLSAYGLKIVSLPSEVWDAIDFMSLESSIHCITPGIVKKFLKTNESCYRGYSYYEKLNLLQYCLSDGVFTDLVGVYLLPLADNTFTAFTKRTSVNPAYLCTDEYPSSLIPSGKNHLAEVSSDNRILYERLIQVAEQHVTQLVILNAGRVAMLLKKCLPTSIVIPLPHKLINRQWLEEFWRWAAKQADLLTFSNLPVVPACDSTTSREYAVKLSPQSPCIFTETPDNDGVINMLYKFNVKVCDKSKFEFVCFLNGSLMNQLSADGVLGAISHANAHRNVTLTTTEAASLRKFLCTYSQSSRGKATLKDLNIFTTLSNSLYSVNNANNGVIEPSGFPLSPQYLPCQLLLFSRHDTHQLQLLESLSVPQHTTIDLLLDYILKLFNYSPDRLNLMREVLGNIHFIIAHASILQREQLKLKIGNLSFVPVHTRGSVFHKPRDLFDPSDSLLSRLFQGKLLFPVEPFSSAKYLAVLKSCGLKQTASPKNIVDIVLEITREQELVRSVEGVTVTRTKADSVTFTRTKAVMEWLSNCEESELSEVVNVSSKLITLSKAIVAISRQRALLPVQASPPEHYPPSLSWKGNSLSQHLVKFGSSTILCHSSSYSLLGLACGSQVHFVEHSLPVRICNLFIPSSTDLVRHVIAHLKHVIIAGSNISREKLRTVICAVYQLLQNNLQQTITNVSYLPPKWIYIPRSNVFLSPTEVALEQNSSFYHNLEPFIYTLPDSLLRFESLFTSIGVESQVSKQQIVYILATIKDGYSSGNLGIGHEKAWELVLTILSWLTGNGEHKVNLSDCGILYAPMEDPNDSCLNWPKLLDHRELVYTDNDFLRRIVRTSNDGKLLKFVSKRISPQMAQLLGIAPLSQYMDIADDAFDDQGPHEPLIVRLKNILKDYKDGLTIIKELLQNADDAGASEFNVCYDARNHNVSPGQLLFPGTAGCHGPALVVHNNAMFTQEDFKNITKLAGATKANKALKIGKFGIGFCSVYHMTDIPSFISDNFLYMFDPTLSYLKEDIKNHSRPGKKVNHVLRIVVDSEQLTPYQGLFGFQKGHKYKGTMFRFPFRTSSSQLSNNTYSSHTVQEMFGEIQSKSSELILFLQHVKSIKIQEISSGQQEPKTQVEITKNGTGTISTSLLKIYCSSKETTYWLVCKESGNVLKSIGTASIACSLSPSYTPCSIEGEVFCFLPLSVKTGLPVHVSGNFAVNNNRTGLWSSDDLTSNYREVMWNKSLMKSLIAKVYFSLLVSLKTLSQNSGVKGYVFYLLWPLISELKICNPWEYMIETLYQQIIPSELFFSSSTNEWLSLQKGRFLAQGILSSDPSNIPQCVKDAIVYLALPIIDLPQAYYRHLSSPPFINEVQFLQFFFQSIRVIPVDKRNKVLCVALECYAIELDRKSKRRSVLHSYLSTNSCVPCTPDGNELKKCHELIKPEAYFAGLYEKDEGYFPHKSFCEKPLVSQTMEFLGIISSHLPIQMLKERARSVSSLFKKNKGKALNRTKMILSCLGTYSCPYEEDKEMTTIPFIPVMPKPKGYLFNWNGDQKELCSGRELVLRGETATDGDKWRNVYIAGSQVPFANELEVRNGGCGYIYSAARIFLKIRDTPCVIEVIKHFTCVISSTPQSVDSKTAENISATVRTIYRYLENQLRRLKEGQSESQTQSLQAYTSPRPPIDISPILSLPCIWTGNKFVSCKKVAKEWKQTAGPYLYRVPSGYFNNVWNALKIKTKFTATDLLNALSEMGNEFGSSAPVPEECREILRDILSELQTLEIPTNFPTIMLPDETFSMCKASALAFNDAQWLPPLEGTRYVCHKVMTRDLAEKLGVKMVRNITLREHKIPLYKTFGQREKLTTRIQGILKDYPFDVTILKEMLQNADDAKASKMYIILDQRTHKSDEVLSENWKELQGPALLIWNDSVFTDKDIEGIQQIGMGGKQSDAETIGQYGIGFNSVYHLTDCPSFISAGSLCIFDPHCKYVPEANERSPGGQYKESILSMFPDLAPSYLRCGLDHCTEHKDLLQGSIFRFPLRHTAEQVHDSEIVCEIVGDQKIFKGVITAQNMYDYLQKWAPQMKQSMFFLNHVTDLKFFVIHDGMGNTLTLHQHYKVHLDDSAVSKRKQLHKKLGEFNKVRGAEPFITKYRLTLTENEDKEEWLIQQGVGDINNKNIEWKFIQQVKPRHGIAVPMKLKTHPHLFRGRAFCFLPLPVDCNLPVHINGHFILTSSRRMPWKTSENDQDIKQEWNKFLLMAVANSYANLLVTIRKDYGIECGQVMQEKLKRYYKIFPSWTAPPVRSSSAGSAQQQGATHHQISALASTFQSQQQSGPRSTSVTALVNRYTAKSSGSKEEPQKLPTEEWLTLAQNVFKILADNKSPVMATNDKVIEWCPPIHDDPASQIHFVNESTPKDVLKKIGMKLTNTQHWVRKHFVKVGYSIPTAEASVAYKFYTDFHSKILPNDVPFPCQLAMTSFKTIDDFKKFLEFIVNQIPKKKVETPSSKAEVTSPDIVDEFYVPDDETFICTTSEEDFICATESSVISEPELLVHKYPPLIVTADGILRYCNEETDAVIRTAFTDLFPKCQHFLLHPKLTDIAIPEHFILQPSDSKKPFCLERINMCLDSILPPILKQKPFIHHSMPREFKTLWACLSCDYFFKLFLKDILRTWALIPSQDGTHYSCLLQEEAVLPIIPLGCIKKEQNNNEEKKYEEISLKVCQSAFSVYKKLKYPFLDTDIVTTPSTLTGICPTLYEPAFMLRILCNFHRQVNISQYITKDMASSLLTYFWNIHLKKDAISLDYLMQLPLFETHQGQFTSLSGKTIYQWPPQMCEDGQDLWLEKNQEVVFLSTFGAWSKLELHRNLNVYLIYPTEIYSKFVFPIFGEMDEMLRYKHLWYIQDNLFQNALAKSQSRRSDEKYICQVFINDLYNLACIGTNYPLMKIHQFYDPNNLLFKTFRENFNFLPDTFTAKCHCSKNNQFLQGLGFHFKINQEEYLVLCREIFNKKHLENTIEKSSVLFQYLFKNDAEELLSDNSFVSQLINIPFVLADRARHYTWLAKTPPENNARGTCTILTKEDEPIYLTNLSGACIYDDITLIWSVKPVFKVPRHGMNPTNVLSQLKVSFKATVEDVIHHLVTLSETGPTGHELFVSYTAPVPSSTDVGLVNVIAECFDFLRSEQATENQLRILKNTQCIPVQASEDDKGKIVIVKPSEAVTSEPTTQYFPYLHKVPNELMASSEVLEKIGVKDRIQPSHIQMVLNAIHHQLGGIELDPNSIKIVSSAIGKLCDLLSVSNETWSPLISKLNEVLSPPLYLPGQDGRLHLTSNLVYPDSYSYKDCKLPESSNYVIIHHPGDIKDQYNFANRFCSMLPKGVRPKPLSKLCNQKLMHDSTVECDDVEAARCLQVALKLEFLPTVCIGAFKKYAKSITWDENVKELLSSFLQNVQVVAVSNLEVALAMQSNPHRSIGTAKVEFFLCTMENGDMCLYLDSTINRMVEHHIHDTLVHELLKAIISNVIGAESSIATLPGIHKVFSLFLKSQTNQQLFDACKMLEVEVDDESFVSPLNPCLGHPIPEEWHYRLDQNPDNIFHPQDIVGYEIEDRKIVFALVLYRVPPDDLDIVLTSDNEYLTKYKITIGEDKELLVTALKLYKFVVRNKQTRALISSKKDVEIREERTQFSEVSEAKRHLCRVLKEIWTLEEPERSTALRRQYLLWHPDKNLDNIEFATEVFQFLLAQIERLEQGLEPKVDDEEETVPPSHRRSQYSGWNQTASSHRSHQTRHEEYFRSGGGGGGYSGGASGFAGGGLSGSWMGGGFAAGDWTKPTPDVAKSQCWIAQALCDFRAVEAIYEKAETNSKLCSHVCFMAHEVAEKALKGGMYAVCGLREDYLVNHKIIELARMLQGEKDQLTTNLPTLATSLEAYYLNTRFPNRWTPVSVPSHHFTISQAEEARDNAKKILEIVMRIIQK